MPLARLHVLDADKLDLARLLVPCAPSIGQLDALTTPQRDERKRPTHTRAAR